MKPREKLKPHEKLAVEEIKEMVMELIDEAPTTERKITVLRAVIEILNERAHEH